LNVVDELSVEEEAERWGWWETEEVAEDIWKLAVFEGGVVAGVVELGGGWKEALEKGEARLWGTADGVDDEGAVISTSFVWFGWSPFSGLALVNAVNDSVRLPPPAAFPVVLDFFVIDDARIGAPLDVRDEEEPTFGSSSHPPSMPAILPAAPFDLEDIRRLGAAVRSSRTSSESYIARGRATIGQLRRQRASAGESQKNDGYSQRL
jgi:hypothetical protein